MQKARLQDYTVYFENSQEYHQVKREVWGRNQYYAEFSKSNPVIIDAGANIGLTTLYYKRQYPDSTVVAIEPLPQNAALLRKNIEENQLEGVVVEEVALSDSEGERSFYLDKSGEQWYSTASLWEGAWNGEQKSERVLVATKQLSNYLEQYRPELVKLDIEGAEGRVLAQARDELGLCQHYLIEWHPMEGNNLSDGVRILEEAGYHVEVRQGTRAVEPDKARGLVMVEARRDRV